MNPRPVIVTLLFVVALAGGVDASDEVNAPFTPPARVSVLPIFLVPRGQGDPSLETRERLVRHLAWAQERYREMLGGRTTFRVARSTPMIHHGRRDLAGYAGLPEMAAPEITAELLDDLHVTPYNCPYIVLVLVVNPEKDFPPGGGRPLNGGYGTGGGVVVLSTFALDRKPNFQATLQHELGHAFGLPHVDVYGYDMATNPSIMSYNPRHHTREFRPSETPGALIPEDLRGLALNRRVFESLGFDARHDAPAGYRLRPIVALGPMRVPGHTAPLVTTTSGETYGTHVTGIVQNHIFPSQGNPFHAESMWHSAPAANRWVSVTVTFPAPVRLSRLGIYSQHSGLYHAAGAVRIAGSGAVPLRTADAMIRFPVTTSRAWTVALEAGPSGFVVLRGLRFFDDDVELFPTLVPYPLPR